MQPDCRIIRLGSSFTPCGRALRAGAGGGRGGGRAERRGGKGGWMGGAGGGGCMYRVSAGSTGQQARKGAGITGVQPPLATPACRNVCSMSRASVLCSSGIPLKLP